MRKLKYLALIAAIAATGPASAGLVGQQVTGSLTFRNSTINQFFPSTVIIKEPGLEFSFSDGANIDTADFTDTQLIIEDNVSSFGTDNWHMKFTSVTPGLFTSISLVSGNFPGGLTSTVTGGNTITIDFGGTGNTGVYAATFNIGSQSPSVPEPTILALMSLGLAGIGLGKYRRVPTASA